MFETEKQQVEICLLNSNLKEVEDELDVQRSTTVPVINAEVERKNRQRSNVLNEKREVSEELERLQLENIRLKAKSAKLKESRDKIVEENKSAAKLRDELTRTLNQKEEEMDMIAYKYGESCRERAERFRKTHRYYNKEEVTKETEEVNKELAVLKEKENKSQRNLDRLRAHYEAMQPNVPENLHLNVDILREIAKSLEQNLENLKEELQALQREN